MANCTCKTPGDQHRSDCPLAVPAYLERILAALIGQASGSAGPIKLDLPTAPLAGVTEPSPSTAEPQKALPIRRGDSVALPALVRSGSTLSAPVDLGALALVGLEVPKLPASVAIFVRVSRSQNGEYFRLQQTDASGDWTIAASTGEKTIFIPDLSPFRYVKWELASAQTIDIVGFFVGKL